MNHIEPRYRISSGQSLLYDEANTLKQGIGYEKEFRIVEETTRGCSWSACVTKETGKLGRPLQLELMTPANEDNT